MTRALDETVSLEIPASAPTCYAWAIDFEAYPRWQKTVASTRLVETNETGPLVDFSINVIIGKINYTLQYKVLEQDFKLEYEFVRGDIKNASGELIFIPNGSEHGCLATYRIKIDPGFWVPSPIVQIIKQFSMMGFLKDLKKYAGKFI